MEKMYFEDSESLPAHKALFELGYYYDLHGRLRCCSDRIHHYRRVLDSRFRHTAQNEDTYRRLAQLMLALVQQLLCTRYHMREVQVPFPEDNAGAQSKNVIYVSGTSLIVAKSR